MPQGNSLSAGGGSATAMLSDEQILDMEVTPDDAFGETGNVETTRGRGEDASSRTGASPVSSRVSPRVSPADSVTDPLADPLADADDARELQDAADGDGEPRRNLSADADPQDTAAGEPAWLATLDAQPEAAAEARRWHAAANDVAALDAAYFSADSAARSGLAARLYDSDPAAFREMLAASARTLAARDPQGLAELARQLGMPVAEQTANASKSVTQAARSANRPQPGSPAADLNAQAAATTGAREAVNDNVSEAAKHGATFPAEMYRTFESTTNDDVSRKMHEAIDRSLLSALPEGVAAGARRRIGEDIFREVHAALSGDRELARQVGETLRDWRFDSSARQQVVALVSGRARAVLPAVARRVVAEWTSSVLASDRAKTARIDAAASRRDITGGRLPEPVAGSARRSRDVDYRRMSDEQILDT